MPQEPLDARADLVRRHIGYWSRGWGATKATKAQKEAAILADPEWCRLVDQELDLEPLDKDTRPSGSRSAGWSTATRASEWNMRSTSDRFSGVDHQNTPRSRRLAAASRRTTAARQELRSDRARQCPAILRARWLVRASRRSSSASFRRAAKSAASTTGTSADRVRSS